jgi:hypothetical protein
MRTLVGRKGPIEKQVDLYYVQQKSRYVALGR